MHSAELIFQQAGLKSTISRLEVATVLAQNNHPLTHQDILKQLPESFDRVTLYRVLDWLLKNNVIHRIAGEDRAWRFQLNQTAISYKPYSQNTALQKKGALNQHQHAHFQCAVCAKVFCLNDVHAKLTNAIPTDFVVDSIELTIKGKCASCRE